MLMCVGVRCVVLLCCCVMVRCYVLLCVALDVMSCCVVLCDVVFRCVI